MGKLQLRLLLASIAVGVGAVAAKLGDWRYPMIANGLVWLSLALFIGIVVWTVVDGMIWWMGEHGRFQRACYRQYRAGKRLLTQQRLSQDDHSEWQEGTVRELVRCLGEAGHECINDFEAAGNASLDESLVDFPQHRRIRKQLAVLHDLVRQSRERQIVLVRKQ